MTDIVSAKYTLDILGSPFTLYPNGVVINGKPLQVDYDKALQRLSLIESASSWWWGDIANGRERDYGSLKELAGKYGVDYGALREYQRVASKYELSMRIDSLSFNHHQIVASLENRLEWLNKAVEFSWSVKELKMALLRSQIEPPSFDGQPPLIENCDCQSWLLKQESCDLLLTDPPYSPDIDIDIEEFVAWLPPALNKVKSTGHAYIFIGPYPREVRAYLNVLEDRIAQTQLLVWEYRNTMGPSPTHGYKNNWQAIIYFCGLKANPLNSPLLLEQYSVQEFPMPNSKDNPYHHTWEKPEELAEIFIRHSTQKGDIVYDPFLGTGTFLVTAAKYGRVASGCDIDDEMLGLAIKKGCKLNESI